MLKLISSWYLSELTYFIDNYDDVMFLREEAALSPIEFIDPINFELCFIFENDRL